MLAVNVDFGKADVPKERRLALGREMSDRLAELPGVVSAAQVGSTPVSGNGWDQNVGPDGTRATGSGKQAFFNRAAPGYFRTMGTRLLAGREFDDRDTLIGPRVAIINEMFALRYLRRSQSDRPYIPPGRRRWSAGAVVPDRRISGEHEV